MVRVINGGAPRSRGRSPAAELNNTVSLEDILSPRQDFEVDSNIGSLEDFMGSPNATVDQMVNADLISIDGSASAPTGPVSDGSVTEANISRQTEILEKRQEQQAMLAGARLFTDVMNAQSQYNSISQSARTNIYLANQSAADAISRGKQQGLFAEQAGRDQGEMAKLSMAAQGQDVQGEGVSNIVEGQEAVGIYNAMIAEMNASREALGFEQEAIQYMGQIEQAEIQRNFQIFNSVLSFSAAAVPLGS